MGQHPAAFAAAGTESKCWARAAVAVAQRGVSLRSHLASCGLDLDDGSGWQAGAGPALWTSGGREADAVWVLCCFSQGRAAGRAALCAVVHAGRGVAWRLLDWGWVPGGTAPLQVRAEHKPVALG